MKCAHHPEQDAIGICTACARGVCSECAVDLGRALACRDRCESETRRLLDLRDFEYTQPHYVRDRERSRHTARTVGIAWGAVASLTLLAGGIMQGEQAVITVGAVVAIITTIIMLTTRRKVRTDQFRLCQNCGYNNTANTTGRCPECGHFL